MDVTGLDFSDGRAPNATYDQHPDLNSKGGSTFLQRNKTERRRLQGLQRTVTQTSTRSKGPRTFREKFNVWLINEGGRQLFFGVYIFLHILVAVFGFIHYQLKDSSVGARALFGITFRAQQSIFCSSPTETDVSSHSYCQDCSARSPCRCHLHPPPRVPQLCLLPSTYPFERHHPL